MNREANTSAKSKEVQRHPHADYIQKAIELCPNELEFRTKYEVFIQ